MDGRTFRNIAIHWQRGHGFDVHALRERLILPKYYRFASLEYRELKRKQGLEGGHAERLRALPRSQTKRQLSTYAKLDNARKSRLVSREQRLAALAKVDRTKAAAGTRARWEQMSPEERHRKMSDLGKKGGIALQKYLQEHPEARELAMANRKARHGY